MRQMKMAGKKKQIRQTVHWKVVSAATKNKVGNEGVDLREKGWRRGMGGLESR